MHTTSQIAWIPGFSTTDTERRERGPLVPGGRNISGNAFPERGMAAACHSLHQ
jgi:hypothetical protein